MAYINIKQITFKNVLSYGNALTTFTFENGLNGVTGKNGNGKSAFLTDTICYALYGKPYRDIKIEELINNRNKKNLWVSINFQKGSKNYIIERGIKPDVLKIVENDKELELASTKGLIQEEIDKILGVNYKLFKNIIALSINSNKPFLKLDSKDKKEIIESIFNIKVFGEMLKIVKKETTVLKSNLEMKENEINVKQEAVSQLNTQIIQLKNLKSSFETDKTTKINNLEKDLLQKNIELENLKKDIVVICSEIEILENTIKEYDKFTNEKKLLEETLTNLKTSKILLESNINNPKNYTSKDIETIREKIVLLERENLEIELSKFQYDSKVLDENLSKIVLEKKEKENYYNSLSESFVLKNLVNQEILDLVESTKIGIAKKSELETLLKNMKDLGVGACPSCNQPLTKDHLEAEITRLTNDIDSLTRKLSSNKSNIKTNIERILTKEKTDTQILINELKVKYNETFANNTILEETAKNEFTKYKKDKIELYNEKIFKNNELIKEFVLELKKTDLIKVSEYETSINDIKEKIGDLVQKTLELSELNTNKIYKMSNKQNIIRNIDSLESSVKNIETNITEEKTKEFTIDIKPLEVKFLNDSETLLNLQSVVLEIIETLKHNKIIDKMLSEDGIKTYFINSILTSLNNQINSYLDLFNLPIKIEFDNTLEETIVDSYNKPRSYESFSSGEQKRIDLSIILSFIKINKIINNFDCNIMIMDEILDSSIDNEGLELVIESIAEMVERENIGVYVISHRAVQSAYFNKFYNIEKVEGFSKIGVL